MSRDAESEKTFAIRYRETTETQFNAGVRMKLFPRCREHENL